MREGSKTGQREKLICDGVQERFPLIPLGIGPSL